MQIRTMPADHQIGPLALNRRHLLSTTCEDASENKTHKKKGTIMYIVFDSCNKPLRRFSSWKDAFNYKQYASVMIGPSVIFNNCKQQL